MSSGHLQQDQVSVYYCSHSNTHSSHTSISESISKFKAFQKAMLRTMITISGLLSFFFTSYVKPMLMLTVSVSISPFDTFSSSVYTCHLRFEIHVNFAYFLDFLH